MNDPILGNLLLLTSITSGEIYLLASSLFVLILLFIGSAMVSGSEVAYFSLTPEQLEESEESNNIKIKRRIILLLVNPKKLLATILILNNFINITIVLLSSYVTLSIFANDMSGASLLVILTIAITFLMVFLGEIVPKVYATQNNFSFASRTVGLLSVSSKLLNPLSWLLIKVSGVIEKRIEKQGYTASVDELNEALNMTLSKGASDEEKEMLKGIVNFGTLTVKQVMKARMDITAIDCEMDFHKLMNQINKSGYSRLPVFDETVDNIKGILYIKDLLPHINEEAGFKWQEKLRPGFYVPETKKIDTLFKDFQDKRIHIAIVVDEYGGTSGLITMEDVIEEIVGEINDEYDQDSDVIYNKLDNDTFVFEGKTSLMDFCKLTQVEHKVFDEVKGESESLGGLLLELNFKLPKTGEKIRFKNFLFTIVSVNDKRIKKISAYITR